MNEMVERVARVIADCGAPGNWDRCSEPIRDSWRDEARAAIAAMREPTAAMVGVAIKRHGHSQNGFWADTWNEQIDEALK